MAIIVPLAASAAPLAALDAELLIDALALSRMPHIYINTGRMTGTYRKGRPVPRHHSEPAFNGCKDRVPLFKIVYRFADTASRSRTFASTGFRLLEFFGVRATLSDDTRVAGGHHVPS